MSKLKQLKRITQSNRYMLIPNSLILFSCEAKRDSKEELYLSVYCYSVVNANYADNNIVDTNISLIQSTIANFGRPAQQVTKIKEVLKDFGTGKNGYQCITYRYRLDNVGRQTRLQFYVNNYTEKDCEGGFTNLDYDEYNYLIDIAYNQQINKEESSKSYNTVFLINLYCYMKMKIRQYNNMGGAMKESQKTIATNFGKSKKTITTYLNRLEEIGMLCKIEEKSRAGGAFKKSKDKNKEEAGYILDNKWRKNFDAKK